MIIDENELELGNLIAAEVLKEFENVINKGKPMIRSNGIKEWTILASIVAIIKQDDKLPIIKVITLTTGAKALPGETIEKINPKGCLIHDSHAEILSLRLFNYYLINEILRMKYERLSNSTILESLPNDNYQIKKNVELGLYISELPCGDSSIQSDIPWKGPIKKLKTNQGNEILRGRNNFDQLGVIRTKPGRSDSLISYSKSCSDKLTILQDIGILNCVTSQFISIDNSFLKYLILPNEKIKQFGMNLIRCFFDRFPNCDNYFKIIPTTKTFPFSINFEKNSVSCMNAILYLPIYKEVSNNNLKSRKSSLIIHQIINNGILYGSGKLKNGSIKPSSSSVISRRKLLELSLPILNIKDYKKLKQINNDRNSLKKKAKKKLGDWVPNVDDYFELS